MNMNDHPKSNRRPSYLRHANSGGSCSSVTHPGVHPARAFMICLGWLRLYQTILSNRSRTRRAKAFRTED